LKEYTPNITVYDPWANAEHVFQEYGIKVTNDVPKDKFDAVILAVAHNEFLDMDVKAFAKDNSVIYDVKGILDRNIIDGRL
jgi:UDP-N-acetyl-D-galactosamine dehydrogenase